MSFDMASERSKLDENINNSKNTRMNLVDSMRLMDLRKDELMHIGRYFKACQTAVNLSKELGRPIKVLDLGCGEAYSMRLFYKSFLVKKSDVIERYFGVDIDKPMLKRTKAEYGEVNRVLRDDGVLLLSTPNSNGSNKKLPKDHVYEWSYEELLEAVKHEGFTGVATGTCINPSKIPQEVWRKRTEEINFVYNSFGENTAFSCVALAPLFPVEYSKNMLFELRKG